MTPRSGSTFLQRSIRAEGDMGNPTEWFNKDAMPVVLDKFGISEIKVYVEFIRKRFRSNIGVFGTEITWPQLTELAELIDLETAFPDDTKYFFLRRKNVVAQAISLYVASESNVFHSYQMDDAAQQLIDELAYSENHIVTLAQTIIKEEREIAGYLHAKDIQAENFYYEDITQDVGAAINSIRCALTIPVPEKATAPDVGIRKMGSQRNLEWEQKFRQENPETLRDLDLQRDAHQ